MFLEDQWRGTTPAQDAGGACMVGRGGCARIAARLQWDDSGSGRPLEGHGDLPAALVLAADLVAHGELDRAWGRME